MRGIKIVSLFALTLILLVCVFWPWLTNQTYPSRNTSKEKPRRPDVAFVPTPQVAVEKMLELGEIGKHDVVYDLGCGDGRIVITAAIQYGVLAVGFDIDPQRVKDSRANVRKHNVSHLVRIEQQDLYEVDLRQANVVTLFLATELNKKLVPQIAQMKPGSRVISYSFGMGEYKPDTIYNEMLDGEEVLIYVWKIPLNKVPRDPRGAEFAPPPRENAISPGINGPAEKPR